MFGICWIDSLGRKFNCSRLKCCALIEVKINCEIPNTGHIRAAPKSGRREEVPHLPRVQTIPGLITGRRRDRGSEACERRPGFTAFIAR